MYNFSDIIKYERNRDRSPPGSLAELYWQSADTKRAVYAQEYRDPSKSDCAFAETYGKIDPFALAKVADACSASQSDIFAVHLRLGDAMDRGDEHLAVKEATQVASNLASQQNVHIFAGVHNHINVARTERHLRDIEKALPNATVHFSKEHNSEAVDAAFCEMVGAREFVKSYGGFSERICQARCHLGLPVFELGEHELQPFECSRTAEVVPSHCM